MWNYDIRSHFHVQTYSSNGHRIGLEILICFVTHRRSIIKQQMHISGFNDYNITDMYISLVVSHALQVW